MEGWREGGSRRWRGRGGCGARYAWRETDTSKKEGGGACLFAARLSHETIDHAPLSRQGTVPIPNRDTSNIGAFITLRGGGKMNNMGGGRKESHMLYGEHKIFRLLWRYCSGGRRAES